MELLEKQYFQVVEFLRSAKRVLVITGAGVSAESGLPTYRGITGLYNQTTTEDGYRIETALSGPMFQRDPKITWKYIAQIEESCRGKRFNRAHEIISEMEGYFNNVLVLTQNIDGFHHQAGSSNVIDIHGDVHDLICAECDYTNRVENYQGMDIPPYCPSCQKVLRPNVVLFEEILPYEKLQRLDQEFRKGFDVYFSIGTTSVFPYIAQPMLDAKRKRVPTVEINPSETEISGYVDVKIEEKAGEALDQIWKLFQGSITNS
ncbi:MAG: NAD-dependent protein deacylase [Deltaproteobacteria bacterium]|nr:NAD-dependent protein deacylase [Deltaproteobacteria bacterium]